MNVITGTILAALVLVAISLQRAYAHLPSKELKRRSRAGDSTATILHQAATYGVSLRVLLWLLIGLTAASFFVFTSRHLDTIVAIVVSAGVVWCGFAWLSNKEAKSISLAIAKTLAPVFAWLLQYLHSPIAWVNERLRKYHPVTIRTGLYDKEDLLELLNSQNVQADNRIEEEELALAFHALTFGDKLVSDYMTPRRAVKTVAVGDDIGPVLMDELHASGFSRFPVYEGKKDNIVGTLFMRDLVRTKGTSKVSSVMRPDVYYVHEDQNLHDALQAILKTRHHLLIVVNSFEDYVGVLSFEDILEELIGTPIRDEFDQYEDMRAVARRAAHKEHVAHEEAQAVTTDDEVVE